MADNRKSVAYLRTSSGTNVGPDKDSEKRQKAAIQRHARRTGITVVEWFNDPAVSGADPIEARPGFSALLDRIENNGVKIVLVEDASRFARDLVAQELGLLMLIKRGVRVLTAAGDDMTDTSDPSRIMMRQIVGSFRSTRRRAWLPSSRQPVIARRRSPEDVAAVSPWPRCGLQWWH